VNNPVYTGAQNCLPREKREYLGKCDNLNLKKSPISSDNRQRVSFAVGTCLFSMGQAIYVMCIPKYIDILKPQGPYTVIQSDQQETKSRVLPHLLFYRNVFLSWISRFYLLAVDTRFVGCLPLKNLSLIAFINFL
jgi:hypothetical protein